MTREPTQTQARTLGRDSTTQLILDIAVAIAKLEPLAGRVRELVSLRQGRTAYVSPDARDALDQATREERAARVDTTPRPVGQQWMRGTTADDPLGSGQLVGRPAAISCDAEIQFTLFDLLRRLSGGLDRAGVDVCVIPRIDRRTADVHQLLRHLTSLVHLTADEGWSRLLIQVRRDLERLIDQADLVIHGPRTTAYGDCPHCGQPTIVVELRTSPLVVRCDVDRRTNQLERCQCGDDYCLCKYKPIEFRHTWTGAPGATRFKRLRRLAERPTTPTPAGVGTNNEEPPS